MRFAKIVEFIEAATGPKGNKVETEKKERTKMKPTLEIKEVTKHSLAFNCGSGQGHSDLVFES